MLALLNEHLKSKAVQIRNSVHVVLKGILHKWAANISHNPSTLIKIIHLIANLLQDKDTQVKSNVKLLLLSLNHTLPRD